MIIGSIREIWRYPVKSMFGEKVEQAKIEKMGLPEDRAWALRDEESGDLVGGKKIPGIMTLRARYTATPQGSFTTGADTETEILFPDGRSMLSSDPYIDAVLSMYLGRRVSLCQRLPASEKSHYALTQAPSVQETRYALGIRPEEDNPDLSSFSLGLLATLSRYATPPGTFYDVYPLHFLTTASLETMRAHYPEGDFRVERYRPSFVIETAPELTGLVETSLRGARLKIGECTIHCDHPTIRCSMPGAAQPGMAADPGIPMAVMRHANRHLGAYATPRVTGSIRVGDSVELLPRRLRGLFNGMDNVGKKVRKSLLDATANLENKQTNKKRQANSAADVTVKPPATKLPPGFRPFALAHSEDESPGIRSFYFTAIENIANDRYVPGQHIVIALQKPGSSQTIYRPYTLSEAQVRDNCLRITVKHEQAPADANCDDGEASSILHNQLQPGDEVFIRGPLGNFGAVPTDNQPLVLISGGIGITPFIAILQAIAAENPAREVRLFHSVRNPDELAFASTLADLADTLHNFRLMISITGSCGQTNHDTLPLKRERLSVQAIVDTTDTHTAQYFICGKPAFSQDISRQLEQCGVERKRIQYESFGKPISSPGYSDTKQRQVHFANSGYTANWDGEHSLLELAEHEGIGIASGCRYGACHACQATLVSGEYRYPEGVERPSAKDQVLLCCMQPTSDITLDL